MRVEPLDLVIERAERLLAVHALKAAGALQLAAALVAVQEKTSGFGFVSFDLSLNLAAEKEGFDLGIKS